MLFLLIALCNLDRKSSSLFLNNWTIFNGKVFLTVELFFDQLRDHHSKKTIQTFYEFCIPTLPNLSILKDPPKKKKKRKEKQNALPIKNYLWQRNVPQYNNLGRAFTCPQKKLQNVSFIFFPFLFKQNQP